MKIAVLGTGIVGQTIGSKLIELGHQVKMGSRSSDNPKGLEWVAKQGPSAQLGNFSDASQFGEIIFNCTKGVESVAILKTIPAEFLAHKIMIDLTNPLDFSQGMPPTLSICNTQSLGEDIQANFPELKVVKTLNTMWCGLMVNPKMIGNGNHENFICGNDPEAKTQVIDLLKTFGWNAENIRDLGPISSSRGTEMVLPLWIRLYGVMGTGAFNFRIIQ